jgi:hypothetical protein
MTTVAYQGVVSRILLKVKTAYRVQNIPLL